MDLVKERVCAHVVDQHQEGYGTCLLIFHVYRIDLNIGESVMVHGWIDRS
jgi:hypothetical protein